MSSPSVPHDHKCPHCGKVRACKLKRWHPTADRFCSRKCMLAAGYRD